MAKAKTVQVEITGGKGMITEVLDELAKIFDESYRKEYKVPHYKDLYRGRAWYSPKTNEVEE